jgi:general secretion pathway protein I
VSPKANGSTFPRLAAQHGFTSSPRSAEHGFTFSPRSAQHGFTLIEMLVALAIFSLAALALLRLEGATLFSTHRLADTTVAQIVARNLAVGLLTDPLPPALGTDQGQVRNAGATWLWTRETRRTDDVRIVRIDLAVADAAGRPMTRLSLARAVE